MTEKQEIKQWKEISTYEKEIYGDKEAEYRKAIGEEEWTRLQCMKANYENKRNDRLVAIIMDKYVKTKNKVYLHFLDKMGIDVDYSLLDQR